MSGDLSRRLGRAASNPWVRGVAGTAGTRLVVLFLGLFSTIALARGLGPSGRGIYALAMTVATLGVVALNFGYNTANTFFASREPGTLPILISNSLAMAAAVAAVGAALLGFGWASGLDLSPLPLYLVVLVIAWIPIGVLFIQLQPLLLTLGRVREFNLAEGGWQLTSVALVFGLWVTGHLTPTSAFVVTLAALAGGVIVVGIGLRSAWNPRPLPSIRLFRRAAPYSARSYATTLTGIALTRLDILVVGNRLGTRQVGFYAVAVTICEALQILPATIGALLLPRLAVLKDETERWAITRRVAGVTALSMLVICAVAATVARPAIKLLYGAAYLPGTAALYWLLPGIVLIGVNAVLIHYFLAVGMPPAVAMAQAVGVVLNITLELFLLRPLGLAGAGIASTVAYGATLAMTISYSARWRRGIRGRDTGISMP